MKGKYITTQILLACLSRPVKAQAEPKKIKRFYWDQLDFQHLIALPQTKQAEKDQEFNTAA